MVDDSSIVRKIIGRIAFDLGFKVELASDGLEALAVCKKSMPTCVLLDWNMPNMDGLEFLRVLRTLPNGTEPKVMFCTMEKDEKNIEIAMNATADGYITKPIDNHIIRAEFKKLKLV